MPCPPGGERIHERTQTSAPHLLPDSFPSPPQPPSRRKTPLLHRRTKKSPHPRSPPGPCRPSATRSVPAAPRSASFPLTSCPTQRATLRWRSNRRPIAPPLKSTSAASSPPTPSAPNSSPMSSGPSPLKAAPATSAKWCQTKRATANSAPPRQHKPSRSSSPPSLTSLSTLPAKWSSFRASPAKKPRAKFSRSLNTSSCAARNTRRWAIPSRSPSIPKRRSGSTRPATPLKWQSPARPTNSRPRFSPRQRAACR